MYGNDRQLFRRGVCLLVYNTACTRLLSLFFESREGVERPQHPNVPSVDFAILGE